ncbi:hypothetical protein QQF64_021134 [Cirrhinus molitorella]|uniref:Uncharacterized protein n=1 Tax=Cirrhinus molitorella TaxID=172907 RepID=A0ABR3LB43_9TELE
MPSNRYASALTNNGDRYGNTAVYSKSFVFMIACSAIKSVGTQIKEQPLLWDPSHHSGDRHSGPTSPVSFQKREAEDAGNDRKAALNAALRALRVSFNAELLFMCRNDIMPNQVVFQILIMPLEVHYLYERVLTAISPPEGDNNNFWVLMIKNNAIPNCREKMEGEAEVKRKEKGGAAVSVGHQGGERTQKGVGYSSSSSARAQREVGGRWSRPDRSLSLRVIICGDIFNLVVPELRC